MEQLKFGMIDSAVKKDEKEKGDEFSRFKKVTEALKKPLRYLLISGAFTLSSCMLNLKGTAESDAQIDRIEERDDAYEGFDEMNDGEGSDSSEIKDENETDNNVDIAEFEENGEEPAQELIEPSDSLEDFPNELEDNEGSTEEDGVEDTTDTEDMIEEETSAPECPVPVEHIPPTINPVFENNFVSSVTTTGGEIIADMDLHMSMRPSTSTMSCPSGNDKYEFLCVNEDEINIQGEYYLMGGSYSLSATLPPASAERNICSTVSTEYPIIVYPRNTPESIRNVVYDFGGGILVNSIAGIALGEPVGFYFNVNSTRMNGSVLSFMPSSSGMYTIYFANDLGSITFNTRSLDGRGNESRNSYSASMSGGSSKPLYIGAFNPTDRYHYDLLVEDYNNFGALCVRGVGGPRTVEKRISLDILCAIDDAACGCLGGPSDFYFNVGRIVITPRDLAGTMSISISPDITAKGRINGPTDNPELIVTYTYTPPSDISGIGITIEGTVVVEGVGQHVCTYGISFRAEYGTTIYAYDPVAMNYIPGSSDPRLCPYEFGG